VEHDRFTRDKKISREAITHAKIRNLLENFKTDILGTLTTQLDIMQAKQKQVEGYSILDAERNTATKSAH